MVNYDIVDIRLFERVAFHGQLGPAAAESYMTISAASLRIKKLEDFFHVRFFTRKARGLELTEAGRRFLEDAKMITKISGNLEAKMRMLSQRDKNTIRLYVNYSSIIGPMQSDIGDFLVCNPDYKVDFHLRTSEDIVEAIYNGDADIGVCNINRTPEGMRSVVYSHDNYGLLLEESNPLIARFGDSIRLEDIEEVPLVALNSELINQDWFESHAKERGLQFNVRARFPTNHACLPTLKKLHAGMLILRSSSITKVPGYKFITIEDDWRQLENRICVRDDSANMSKPVCDLFKYLSEMAKTHS